MFGSRSEFANEGDRQTVSAHNRTDNDNSQRFHSDHSHRYTACDISRNVVIVIVVLLLCTLALVLGPVLGLHLGRSGGGDTDATPNTTTSFMSTSAPSIPSITSAPSAFTSSSAVPPSTSQPSIPITGILDDSVPSTTTSSRPPLPPGAPCTANSQCGPNTCLSAKDVPTPFCCDPGIPLCPGHSCNDYNDCFDPFNCNDKEKVCCGYPPLTMDVDKPYCSG